MTTRNGEHQDSTRRLVTASAGLMLSALFLRVLRREGEEESRRPEGPLQRHQPVRKGSRGMKAHVGKMQSSRGRKGGTWTRLRPLGRAPPALHRWGVASSEGEAAGWSGKQRSLSFNGRLLSLTGLSESLQHRTTFFFMVTCVPAPPSLAA